MLLGSCQPVPTEQPENQNAQNNVVENIRVTTVQPSETLVKTETFPLPNCGGTGEIRQTLGSTASISKSVTLSGKAIVRGGGEAGIPEAIKLKLEIEIEAAYQKAYEAANSRLDTINMPAAAGTHVIYDIGWYEQAFSSIVQYSVDGQVYEAPYTYKLQAPKLENSRQVLCGTNTQSATNTNTPEPAVPTATLPPTIQPNTGLQLGQTYRQGNIAFTVVSIDYEVAGGSYSGGYVSINVEVKNVSQSSISFTYGDPTFTVKDNNGIIYKDGFAAAKGRTFEDSIILSSGDSSRLDGYLCCGLAYGVDPSDTSITEIIFIVENLSSIKYAEWVIPINH